MLAPEEPDLRSDELALGQRTRLMQPSELSELPESPPGGSAGDRGEVLLALVVLACQEVGCFIGGAGRRVGAAADEDPVAQLIERRP